jgi:hypothetical protein
MKVKVHIDSFDRAIIDRIQNSLDMISKEGQVGLPPMFSYDYKTEKKMMKKLRKALKITQSWYGSPNNDLEQLLE